MIAFDKNATKLEEITIINTLIQNIISLIFISYIKLVYKTSKIKIDGNAEFFKSDYKEKFVFSFWHGCSYCFYPLIRGEKLCVITTENRRGGYISNICKNFGYIPIRVPDESKGGNYFLLIRKIIKDEAKASVAITFDGPLGPLHEPKVFPFAVALFTKRRVVPISINVKKKIVLNNRWDKFIVPLLFNNINVYVHDPIDVDKKI